MKYLVILPLVLLSGCSTQQDLISENRFQKELINKKNAQIDNLKKHVSATEAENNLLRQENNALWKHVKSIQYVTDSGTFLLP